MHRRYGAAHVFVRPGSIALCARLVLFALVMQMAAVDHWGGVSSGIEGVVGSSTHALHCHGGEGGCSSGHTSVVAVESQPTAPIPATWTQSTVPGDLQTADSISITPPDAPPRAAVLLNS